MSFTTQQKLERYIRSVPKVFKPGENPVITAFLRACALSDAEISRQIDNTKEQLFVKTAAGQNLTKLASSLGVSKPVELGLDDETFRRLIPNLSLKPKQIRKAFYDTADVFWGPLYSRASTETRNTSTYNVSIGDEIDIVVDSGSVQTLKVSSSDVATPGAMTAEELATFLNKFDGATASVIEDQVLSTKTVNLRTDTPGPRGAITILTSTMVGISKVDFVIKKTELIERDQRVMIYEINPNEIVMEIPAIVPSLRRVLAGSHHFHTDETLESPVAPANGVWQGSFFYDPTGANSNFTVTGQNAQLDVAVTKGSVLTNIIVDDNSNFTEANGLLVFGFGTVREEQPVAYRGLPNSKTILIDPSHIFQFTHPINEYVNVLASNTAYVPPKDGSDLPIYLTSPGAARSKVEEILISLAAAGIIFRFVILSPEYKYIIDNPYLTTDDAPGDN